MDYFILTYFEVVKHLSPSAPFIWKWNFNEVGQAHSLIYPLNKNNNKNEWIHTNKLVPLQPA